VPSTRYEWLLFALGTGVLVVLVALILVRETDSASTPVAATSPSTQPSPRPASVPAATSTGSAQPSRTTTTDRPATPAPRLVVRAVDGDSWLEVRSASASGRVLYQGTLAQGRVVAFRGRSFWARFGAAAHLSATLDGRRLPLGTGTFETTIRP
jgi:hypothetical protein